LNGGTRTGHGMRLNGKVAVVTGAGTGIGRAIAGLFGREGARVVLTGRRPEPITEASEEILRTGGHALPVTADVTSAAEVQKLTQATVDTFGRIDILVNNAGSVVSRTSTQDCPESDWLKTIDLNLHSAFLCSKFALPELIKARGNIIQVASVFGLLGAANTAAYTASKGALVSLTRAMAMDLGSSGVRVNSLCPAYVETDLNREMLDGLRSHGQIHEVLGRLPLGVLGQPRDVAYAALFLASDEARWVTGIALPVDGGMSAGRS
jgi:meso-butanediol dehydrogenase / (S,S)-butanediol dehydrogenase / diacetyl reductase